MNTVTMKLALAAVLAGSISAPALAQQADGSQPGDYHAPKKTVVHRPTARQTERFEQGDYYGPGKTVVQRPTARQTQKLINAAPVLDPAKFQYGTE